MTKQDDEPKAPRDGERTAKVSYWDALVAEGFVRARVPKPPIISEGYLKSADPIQAGSAGEAIGSRNASQAVSQACNYSWITTRRRGDLA